jgi:hypothetical protein
LALGFATRGCAGHSTILPDAAHSLTGITQSPAGRGFDQCRWAKDPFSFVVICQ